MKTEQAIKHFEDEIRFCERAPAGNIVHQTEDWTMTLEANRAALAALREKQERENTKPLTEDELRWMIGQPVWIVPLDASGKWAIMSNSLLSLRAGYLAYRYKPGDFGETNKITPMTNGDRVRAMSDEEMAKVMVATYVDEQIHYCQNKQECIDAMDSGDVNSDEKCIGCLVEWLRQPAEVQHG